MREYKIINASTEKTETELNRLAKEIGEYAGLLHSLSSLQCFIIPPACDRINV